MHRVPRQGYRPGSIRALALATSAFLLCFIIWGSYSPTGPIFARMFSLSAAESGLLVALPILTGALTRIPAGLLTDRYGGRWVFTGLVASLLLPVALVGTATSYVWLLFFGLWLGVAGASFAIGIPFIARWFPPENQGLALGIYGLGNIGTAFAGFVVPPIAAGFGWQVSFWVFLLPLALMAALFWSLGRDAPGPTSPPMTLASRLALFRTEPLTWVLSLFYFVTAGGFMALMMYMPTLLVQGYGLELADAAARCSWFVILATVSRPVGGLLADRIGGGQTLNGVFLAIALLAVSLAFSPDVFLLTLTLFAMALAFGAGNGAVFKLVAERFPQTAGMVGGLVGAAGGVGGFIPPILMGVVKDLTGGYALGFILLAAVALSNLGINLLVLGRRTPQPVRQAR